jgi:hypothetical protein
MIRRRPPWDNRPATGGRRLSETTVAVLLDRIETLLEQPLAGEDQPTLERLERTLTDGYAQALRLESDQLKIERRINEVAVSSVSADVKAEELDSLTRRLSSTGGDLERLRLLLNSLRMRARAVRDRARRSSAKHSLQS